MACSNQGSPCGIDSGGQIVMGCNPSEPIGNFFIRYNSFDARRRRRRRDRVRHPRQNLRRPVRQLHRHRKHHGRRRLHSDCTNWINDGVTFDHNLFFHSLNCGNGNLTGISPSAVYTNPSPGTWDCSEKPGAPSIDYISNGIAYPPTDIVGGTRPQHNAPRQAHTTPVGLVAARPQRLGTVLTR